MIQVSNEFKKAIKNQERKIKGYVEIVYDLPNYTIISQQTNTNMTTTYTSVDQISNGVRVENLYGSLDYLPLNGEYITMDNSVNTNSGFISDELFENLSIPNVTISFTQKAINGITMYFKTNIPKNLRIIFSDESIYDIENNEKEMIQIIFDNPKTLTYVNITFFQMEYADRKIYIDEIDLGITQIYKNQDLIEFTIDEEVNKLVEEVPTNETNITLNNMSNLFNPLNPSGIVPYLSKNTLIKPYIGVLTENLGVEYVKMGEFYFDSYTNNSDSTTTLIGKNIIKQVENAEATNGFKDVTFPKFIDSHQPDIIDLQNKTRKAIIEKSGFNCIVQINDLMTCTLEYAKSYNLMDFIKQSTLITFGIVYANRDNTIVIKEPVTSVKDTLTKTELINDVEYKLINKINTIIRKGIIESSTNTGINYDVLNSSYTLKKSTEIVAFYKINPGADNNFTYTNFTNATILFSTPYFAIIEISGTIGTSGTIKSDTQYQLNEITPERKITNRNEELEVILETNTDLHTLTGPYETAIGQLSYAPSYEMKFDYNGDPSLEAGDYVSVETPYGYKPLFIQKNHFKFDGGLEGHIEGVE